MISVECEAKLKQLGRRLRDARLKRNEPQREVAVRLGVSIPTLRKMEQGDPTVFVGLWGDALDLLNHLSEMDHILAPRQSLFEQYEARGAVTRKRASKRKTP